LTTRPSARTVSSRSVILVSNKARIWSVQMQYRAIVKANNKARSLRRPILDRETWRPLAVVNKHHDGSYLIIVNHAMPYTNARVVAVSQR
jgi:hypothetical protein